MPSQSLPSQRPVSRPGSRWRSGPWWRRRWWPPKCVVGATHQAGGATRAQTVEPLRSATPDRPGRIILTGPDPTDPFMLENGGRYYLYTSEGTGILNVPLRIGTRPGRWGSPVDVLPVLPAWAEGGRPGRRTCTGWQAAGLSTSPRSWPG